MMFLKKLVLHYGVLLKKKKIKKWQKKLADWSAEDQKAASQFFELTAPRSQVLVVVNVAMKFEATERRKWNVLVRELDAETGKEVTATATPHSISEAFFDPSVRGTLKDTTRFWVVSVRRDENGQIVAVKLPA